MEVEAKDGAYYYQGRELDIPTFISRKDALEDKIIKLETELIILKAENERVIDCVINCFKFSVEDVLN